MSSRYFLSILMAFSLLFGASLKAQTPTKKYALKDSINVRDKDKMRQWSYENNLTNYPAKKRNNWALGFKGGYSFISGDVRAEAAPGFAINLRKALGHTVSLRAEVGYSIAKGQNWRDNGGFLKNDALNGTNNPAADYTVLTHPFVFYNFRSQLWDGSLQAVFNLNNINFYKKNPKWNLLAFAGIGAMLYRTNVDALDASGSTYDYTMVSNTLRDGSLTTAQARKDVLNQLNNMMDGTYETMGQSHTTAPKIGDYTFLGTATVGFGLAYRVSRRVDLTFEQKATLTFDDLVDGQRWEETLTLTSNFDYAMLTSLGINFRIGKGEDALWWQNPLDEPLDRIRNMDLSMDKANKDSDGDGVMDLYDKEALTPKDAVVDVKGRAIDSDGDGLQDFRDAEPFSPKGAQVDSQGAALDSDKDGVIDLYDDEPNTPAGKQVDAKGRTINVQTSTVSAAALDLNEMMPIVNFDFGKTEVKQSYYAQLYQVAKIMKDNPSIKIRVTGHADNRNTSDFNQKLALKRAENTVAFMTKNFGVDSGRFVVESKGSGEPVVTDLPDKHNTKVEDLHSLNRRVEFSVITQ
ncbi:MAG: OmpA family protein [Bacteroidia bacterium]|nr:OmpA family protein [Bacteroidia bacterium]